MMIRLAWLLAASTVADVSAALLSLLLENWSSHTVAVVSAALPGTIHFWCMLI
jgi:hypothetical protein